VIVARCEHLITENKATDVNIFKDLLSIYILISEAYYEIFDKSGVSYKNKFKSIVEKIVEHDISNDESDLSKVIPDEHLDAAYELKLRKFYDDRDTFKGSSKETYKELKEIIEKKCNHMMLLLMKGPLVIMRQELFETYESEIEWYKQKALQLTKTDEAYEKSNLSLVVGKFDHKND